MAHEAQERYSSMVLAKMRKETILSDGIIFNNDYEGSPAAGVVKIPKRDVEVSAKDYNKADGINPGVGSTEYENFPITKDVAVNEIIDGYDAELVPDNLVADRLDSAAYSLAVRMDTDASSCLIAQGTQIAKAASTPATIYEDIVDLRTRMTKANVPSKDNRRYLLATPDYYAKLLKDDHFVGASNLGDEVKQSGCVGRIAGFNVYEWNDETAGLECIAGHPKYATRATEFSSAPHLVSLEGDSKYVNASAVKGRMAYDHKVLRKQAILVVFAPSLIALVQTAFASGKVTITTAAAATSSFIYRVNPTERATYQQDFTELVTSNAWTSGTEIAAKKGDTVEIIDLDADGKCVKTGYLTVA
ncbi:MAG: hypothetical protein ACI4JQ_00625 [Ruminococcus sp.]